MKRATIILCGLIVVLMMCIVPVAAVSIKSVDSPDGKPTVLIEYGAGKDAGLVKVTHIHYAQSNGKGGSAGTTSCYKFAGWKWSGPVTYTVSPGETELDKAVESAQGEWGSHTTADLFNGNSLGSASWGVRDNQNYVTFGNYPTAGVIAVTSTWYSRATKTAVESDILFDTDFAWGDGERNSSLMDLRNIATHEIGHTLGLSDLYSKSCTAVTMYGYSTEGDTAKRSLELPDITALQMLYGQ